jgi:N-acetylglucosamine kinase-like BadF-type ATPase
VTANAQPDFAALLPAIMRLAEAGDTVAAGALARAGKELARLAAIAIDKIFGAAAKVPVAMSGGVFRHSAAVREVFYNEVGASCPNAVIASRIVDPVDGALSMARTQHG